MRYQLYNRLDQSVIHFKNEDELIYFFFSNSTSIHILLSAKDSDNKKPLKDCSLFHNIAMNLKEFFASDENQEHDRYYYDKYLLLMDELNRIRDPRDFTYEIINGYYNCKNISFLNHKHNICNQYVFRQGPVPHISKIRRKNKMKNSFHKALTEKRKSYDIDHKPFHKPNRNYINSYNYEGPKIRSNAKDRCWKRKKIKKQWMKNLK